MAQDISTKTLGDSIEWAKRFTYGRQLAIGNALEPALTSANIVKQTILGAPFCWWFNNAEEEFDTVIGQQDYTINVPNLAFIDHSSILDGTQWYELENKMSLSKDGGKTARPRFINVHKVDIDTGDVDFRLMPVPDKVYTVNVHMQTQPEVMTGLDSPWQIPDYMSYIYNWGFLALMWMFADDNRWTFANQKFVAALLGASSGLDETQRNIFLNNWNNLTSGEAMKQSQGFQARGI